MRGVCLRYLELQLGYLELMLPCSFFIFLLFEFMLSIPEFFIGVDGFAQVEDGGLCLGQLFPVIPTGRPISAAGQAMPAGHMSTIPVLVHTIPKKLQAN